MFLVVGLVVAFLALANVLALSNWHASLIEHDDHAVAAMTSPADHHGSQDDVSFTHPADEPDSPAIDLHALTHAMIHGMVGLVPNLTVAIDLHRATIDWYAGRSFVLCGIASESLLRPPRF